jgi:hypothetical protein
MASKELLSQRLIWRVGDGQSIKVWGGKWLPTPSSFSIQSPATNLHTDATMSDLIDRDLRGWNHALIQKSFLAEEAKVIIGIPLCP